ncbi:putative methyltransferase [Acorus calamus]|uniref:Methyltransferase n=1 Tax=Acorus calamus TaxID=4465 RepID=A0AAV9CHB0_ACOCL|nr:putative methyltransferase [Acorus calamus]
MMASSSVASLRFFGFRKCPSNSNKFQIRPRLPLRFCRASAVAVESVSETRRGSESAVVNPFACPICYEPLIRKGPSGLNLPAIYRSGFKCRKCEKTFSSKDMYLDLTVTSGTTEYNESKPARSELFRSPFVSFVYERGWRQNFNRSGFPGPDEEFEMAQNYFKPVAGGLLVDVSCGSGLFSRKFAQSAGYSGVVALDFSENMLRQCYEFMKKDDTFLNANLALVRADVSRLPFQSGSVDAVHAGAALHCWPSPSNAVAEISRILRSGGIFVGTTFLAIPSDGPIPPELVRSFRQIVGQGAGTYNNLTEKEIEDLCRLCGLVNFTSKVQRSFIMFCAQKP